MNDEAVSALLRSEAPLVVIEAPAGCGKTWQGASYARDVALTLGSGRLLILTHTHAACSVFAARTANTRTKVEIRTIDALIAQIASAYHKTLGLPADPSAWAWQNDGFSIMAAKVAALLRAQPMITKALARRFPAIICDEHQDSTLDQHSVVMALHHGGAMLRVFGDPWQRIFGQKSDAAVRTDRVRWDALKAQGAYGKLEYPHRWDQGCPELGKWVLAARQSLENGRPIDLTANLPPSLHILIGNNIAPKQGGYILTTEEGRPIRNLTNRTNQMMILANNNLIRALSAFWYRSIPIWEGHTREALANLVLAMREKTGDPESLAQALVTFVSDVAKGFGNRTHGDLLLREVQERCVRTTRGKPANIQMIARCIVNDPTHVGVATAVAMIGDFVKLKAAGFEDIKIDYRIEFRDAIRVGQFSTPDEGYAAIARKRSYIRPSPPPKILSSIHKAKGLECENALVMACDNSQFSRTIYSRCKLYVALSRAKRSLTLVVPTTNPSPLFRIA